MTSFQKPENALKRAEELIDVGKKQDALDTLHLAIQHRKWKNNWTPTIEKIMMKHLELCVELKKMRTAREGLHQYRTTCQAANISSLELVVQTFRKAAEEKVNEAKKLQEGQDLKMAEMDDLDEMEAPQTILLRAIQAHDTRQQSQDRDVHAHFRFLWDTYRVVLDVLKSNARLEEVYHETAQHAFEFCRSNKRPQEFKRLIDNMRKNYLDLGKRTGPQNQHQVNPNAADTITRTIETRFAQLRTATELDLWREAYNTATEIFELMNKARTKPKTRSDYLEYLGQIFWKSENHLFHAFACLKNVLYVKAVKKDLRKDELTEMASKAVMATLCVPFQKSSDIHATLELTAEGQSSPLEKAKKHALLFNAQSVPTRDSIISSLNEKGLIALSAEPCQELFKLIESDFTPLSLCQDAKPFLDQIADAEKVCEGKLAHYITPVKKIIFFRLMKQLSEVYANMTIENFEQAASIVEFSIAEKWMANAARQQGINIQINYRDKAIVFGAPRKVDMKSMRQPLIEIGYKLQQAMQRVAPEEQNKKEKLEKQSLQQNIVKRIEEERGLIRQRREEIERRKEEAERRKDQQEREAMEKIKKQEEKEALAERVRQQEERARRELEREEQKKKDAKMKETKEMLAQMKKQDESSNRHTNLKICGKKLGDIQVEDIEAISFDQIEKAREAQVQRERQEKIRQRKLESKRVDHLSRAIREEEKKGLDNWADTVVDEDNKFLNEAQDREEEKQLAEHEALLTEKRMLIGFEDQKKKWVDEQLASKYEVHKQKVDAKMEKRKTEEAQAKVERARKARAEYEAKEAQKKDAEKREKERIRKKAEDDRLAVEREAEEAERAEAAERQRVEDEARKKEEREAREAKRKEQDEMRARADEKRAQKEREIEERLAGGGRKDDERDDRRGGDRDNWGRGGDRGGDRRGGDRDDRDWGRGGGGDRRGGERDDRDWGRGGGRDDRDRRDDDRGGDRPQAWKRPEQKTRADEEGGWRRGADEEPKREERPWGRGAKGGGRGDDEPKEEKQENPWRKPARDPEPEEKKAPAADDDDDDFQPVGKKKGKAKEEKAPEPAAAADEDDDGFETVSKGKKKKSKAAEEEAPASKPAAPPWRSRGAAGGDDDRKPPSRDDWKSRGKEGGDEAGAAGSRPWNRAKPSGGGGGADGDRWR